MVAQDADVAQGLTAPRPPGASANEVHNHVGSTGDVVHPDVPRWPRLGAGLTRGGGARVRSNRRTWVVAAFGRCCGTHRAAHVADADESQPFLLHPGRVTALTYTKRMP